MVKRSYEEKTLRIILTLVVIAAILGMGGVLC